MSKMQSRFSQRSRNRINTRRQRKKEFLAADALYVQLQDDDDYDSPPIILAVIARKDEENFTGLRNPSVLKFLTKAEFAKAFQSGRLDKPLCSK